MSRESYSFRIEGIEPRNDPFWVIVGANFQREFWREALKIALKLLDRDLAKGQDRFGQPLTPIAPSTRKHRRSEMGRPSPNAPPLTPAYGRSRTRSLLDGRVHDGYALIFWRSHLGQHWGKVLGYHRAGAGRLPVRDVIGIAPATLAEVQRRALAWWDTQKRLHGIGQTPRSKPLQPRPSRPVAAQPLSLPSPAPRLVLPAPQPKPPTKATVEREIGVKFVASSTARLGGEQTVVVDVSKVVSEATTRTGLFGRARSLFTGAGRKFVEMARIAVNTLGRLVFRGGHDRFSTLHQAGATAIPVTVPREQVKEIREQYGATEHTPPNPKLDLAPSPVIVPPIQQPPSRPGQSRVVYVPFGTPRRRRYGKIQVYGDRPWE